jgi:single-strand DNA-binding protein
MTHAIVEMSGNVTADPELRFTQNGIPVASFNVAHTPRRMNRDTQQWEDAGDTLFLRVNVWRDQAQNIAQSIKKGAAVVVIGRLVVRSWQTNEGDSRSSIECEADVVSLDLRRQRVTAYARTSSGAAPEPTADAWATPPASSAVPA